MALTLDRNYLCSILGADVVSWTLTPCIHPVENMTTDSLDHVTVTLADGRVEALFAKTLHPASASELFEFIPPEHHGSVLENLNWLDEPRIYESGLVHDMPEGIRLPKLWAIERPSDDRLVMWMEHVDDEVGPWNLDRYRRSAHALGRLTGRFPEARIHHELDLGRRSLHYLFFGKIVNVDLLALADDATWDDPAVRVAAANDPELRADLVWLAGAVPALLDRTEALPHGLVHGDAAPANFHEPGDGTMVALDWSYGSSGPIGSDLAQLLAGRFESGDAEPDHLDAIAETIFIAFTEGLSQEGQPAAPAELRLAWATHLAVRSAFSAILLDCPGLEEKDRIERICGRAALARFAVGLARSVV